MAEGKILSHFLRRAHNGINEVAAGFGNNVAKALSIEAKKEPENPESNDPSP